jgi:hypothetical protein
LKTDNTAFIAGLRQFLEFLEANPDVYPGQTTFLICLSHRQDPKATLAEVARRFGPVEKVYRDRWFHLAKRFGPIELQWFAHRDQVCRKVVTGKKTVTLAAEDAKPERTVDVEESKWVCAPLLAEAERVADPSYVPTLDEAARHPAEFVEGMTETSQINHGIPDFTGKTFPS